jgi:hypothetical protein
MKSTNEAANYLQFFYSTIRRCNQLGVKIVAGGPLSITQYKDFLGIDYFVPHEAEITLHNLLKTLKKNISRS